MTLKEYLEILEGAEFASFTYEDTVGIHGAKVISYGEVVATVDTKAKAEILFNEMCKSEGII